MGFGAPEAKKRCSRLHESTAMALSPTREHRYGALAYTRAPLFRSLALSPTREHQKRSKSIVYDIFVCVAVFADCLFWERKSRFFFRLFDFCILNRDCPEIFRFFQFFGIDFSRSTFLRPRGKHIYRKLDSTGGSLWNPRAKKCWQGQHFCGPGRSENQIF